MDISRLSEVININPIADVSFDEEDSQSTYPSGGVPAPFPKNLEEFSRRENRTFGSINDFFACLDALKVPGPLDLTNNLVFKIGEGAQFIVYRNAVYFPQTSNSDMYTQPVAVKKSRFMLRADQRLDLSTNTARKQVHDMQLEITALQQNRLRSHRNIVNLLGYSVDQDWHRTPLLVLELAIGDLEVFAKDIEKDLSWPIKQQLCLDVGAGLDILHTCSLVHGDLKPRNVLVFRDYNDASTAPFIAKLADFSYSVDEAKHQSNGLIEVTLWTQGWEAPEIRQHTKEGTPISADEFCKADNYSFGLLVWSVMCLNGSKPVPTPGSAVTTMAIKSIQSAPGMSPTLCLTLTHALGLLLLHNSRERPTLVADLLKDDSETYQSWERACRGHKPPKFAPDNELQEDQGTSHFEHDWTLPSLLPFLVEELGQAYRHHRDKLNAAQIFAMSLLRSYHDIPRLDTSLQIGMLLESARKGYIPAQAVAKRILDSYNVHHVHRVEQNMLKGWLVSGAATGSLVAAAELKSMDAPLFEEAMETFRNHGGYIQFYSPMDKLGDLKAQNWRLDAGAQDEKLAQLDSNGNQRIHYLASFGDADDLANFLDETEVDINAKNSLGETALYKACMRGCPRTVTILCLRGADASIAGIPDGATCLHWLFNFPRGQIEEVALKLANCGGDPNAMLDISSSVVNYHFPFRWPPGTPLHWAVAASNGEAVLALSKLGVSMNLRNRCDPYFTDEFVRTLDFHGTGEEGSTSALSDLCLGFTAIDLASSMHDWRILGHLRSADNGSLDLASVDEEGYSPFHRLEFLRTGRTVRGLRFWYPTFRGDCTTRRDDVLRTVRSLQGMGFDINKLTQPTVAAPGGMSGLNGLSPLMLAVVNCDLEAVDGLLGCGADVNLTNNDGYSALMLLPHPQYHCSLPGYRQGIVQSLLDHQAQVDQVANDGMTALINTAHSPDVAVVSLLLEAGALISDKWRGLSVLAILIYHCSHRRALETDGYEAMESCLRRDSELEVLLRKWVLPGADGGQMEVLEHADLDNGSLLHYTVAAGLVSCVTALLQGGANSNAVRKLHTSGVNMQYNATARIMHEGTPLDIAEKEMAGIIQYSNTSPLSKQDIKALLSHFEQIKTMLEEYGGIAVS